MIHLDHQSNLLILSLKGVSYIAGISKVFQTFFRDKWNKSKDNIEKMKKRKKKERNLASLSSLMEA